jgi:hypothetical protein
VWALADTLPAGLQPPTFLDGAAKNYVASNSTGVTTQKTTNTADNWNNAGNIGLSPELYAGAASEWVAMGSGCTTTTSVRKSANVGASWSSPTTFPP